MANHLTPTELARESGLGRREVLTKCMELGVPDLQGAHRQEPVPRQPPSRSLAQTAAGGAEGLTSTPSRRRPLRLLSLKTWHLVTLAVAGIGYF